MSRRQALTPRELQVLRMASRGLSIKESANEAGLAAETIKSHRVAVMNRLGAANMAHAVALAAQRGLLGEVQA